MRDNPTFAGQPTVSYIAAYNAGQRAYNAGQEYQLGLQQYPVSASDLPSANLGEGGYSILGKIVILDDNGNPVTARYLTVTDDTLPSAEELRDLFDEEFRTYLEEGGDSPNPLVLPPDFNNFEIQYVGIQRT